MAEKQGVRRLGQQAVGVVEDIGLFIILLATIVAAGQEIWHMVESGTVRLADLLLMFIYLEVVAMVASYWNSGQLPVRMPLYIGMVALARYLILDMKAMDGWRILAVAGAVLVLGLAVLVIRYGHLRFPYGATDQKVIDKK
ncbi:phosphate-starvation-inducible protein PsiE [Thiohalomonas denitrificans]|uniref:Protein PsiE n=1 Tax=Thiohalomonas denitrificans TaxID=415747 RepID=A0A1G5QE71_9GAMM|nr:phosphate-starvation-inducible PsiE family protein [Thiohalomonas denitrificans]SCZ60104.1 protein PsiE [Thiohalomonas denitrificans]